VSFRAGSELVGVDVNNEDLQSRLIVIVAEYPAVFCLVRAQGPPSKLSSYPVDDGEAVQEMTRKLMMMMMLVTSLVAVSHG